MTSFKTEACVCTGSVSVCQFEEPADGKRLNWFSFDVCEFSINTCILLCYFMSLACGEGVFELNRGGQGAGGCTQGRRAFVVKTRG